MTWQDPNAAQGPGGSDPPPDADDASLDETRTDWTPAAPPAGDPAAGVPPVSGDAPPPVPPPSVPDPAAGPPAGPPTWAPPPPGQGYPTTTSYDALGQPYQAPVPGHVPPGMAWAPPPEVVRSQTGMQFAEVGPRFAAWLVDSVLLGFLGALLSAPIYLAFAGSIDWEAMFRAARAGNPFAMDSSLLLATFAGSVVSTVVGLVYFVFLWSSGGRATIGMRILKQQIGNAADGATLSMGQAFKRWLAMGYWLSLLGVVPLLGSVVGLGQLVWWIVLLVTTGSSPTRQGNHDKFASTAIVQTAPAANPWVVGCLALVIGLVLSSILGIFALVFLGSQLSEILQQARP